MDYLDIVPPAALPSIALPSSSSPKFVVRLRRLCIEAGSEHKLVVFSSNFRSPVGRSIGLHTQRQALCLSAVAHSSHATEPDVDATSLSQDLPPELSSSVVSFYRNAHKLTSAHEVLESFISGQAAQRPDEKELALRRSLRERRKIVKELIIEFLRANRMGPTYSKTLTSNMAEFVDHIMIEAAALKKKPQHVNASFSFRARLCLEKTGIAKIVKWLKHHHFTPPKIGRLVFMVEDYEGNLQPKIKWLKSINIQGRELGVVLTREPRILEKTMAELKESVEILLNNGVRKEWIGWVIRRSPKVLACEKKELLEQVMFYTRLGIKPDDFGKMVYNFPACLGHVTLDEMYNKVEYLKGFGLDDNTLGEILASKPQLIACSIKDQWKPLVKFFYYLGVDGYGLRKIITVQPSVFCLNLAENIAPKIRFLRDVGVYEEALGDIIVKFPPFLSYSLDNKIKPLAQFLLEEAGVPVENLGKVLSLQPDLVHCSLSNKVQVAVRFFRYHGIHKHDVGAMVTDFPMLLRYSLRILKPKFTFLVKVMSRPLKELVNFPRFFSYSLDSRIVPRHKLLVQKGCQMDLRTMLACSDEEFVIRLDSCGGGSETPEETAVRTSLEDSLTTPEETAVRTSLEDSLTINPNFPEDATG